MQGLVNKAILEEVESKGKKSSSSYQIRHGEHEDMENHPEYCQSHNIFPVVPHRPGSNGQAMPAGCPDFWSKCGVCSMSQNSLSHSDTVKNSQHAQDQPQCHDARRRCATYRRVQSQMNTGGNYLKAFSHPTGFVSQGRAWMLSGVSCQPLADAIAYS